MLQVVYSRQWGLLLFDQPEGGLHRSATGAMESFAQFKLCSTAWRSVLREGLESSAAHVLTPRLAVSKAKIHQNIKE